MNGRTTWPEDPEKIQRHLSFKNKKFHNKYSNLKKKTYILFRFLTIYFQIDQIWVSSSQERNYVSLLLEAEE